MTKLKELAKTYESKTTKNVADLERVPVDMEVEQRTFKQGTPEEFTVDVIVVDGEDYRVPASVLIQLKIHLAEISNLKYIKVAKHGDGLKGTTYTVIPLKD